MVCPILLSIPIRLLHSSHAAILAAFLTSCRLPLFSWFLHKLDIPLGVLSPQKFTEISHWIYSTHPVSHLPPRPLPASHSTGYPMWVAVRGADNTAGNGAVCPRVVRMLQ